MYCKACWYDLRGTDNRRCPECGKRFHPEIPSTYLRYPGNRLAREVWIVLAMQVFAVLMLLGGIFIANSSDEINSPWEAIGVLMVCSVMPIQFVTGIYGVCVALFQFHCVAGIQRFWHFVVTLTPVLIGLTGFIYVFLR